MSTTPFVVGQWVRGENFYGRAALIDVILRGNRNCLWLLGTRRIGKTSLLKQVELITENEPDLGFFPVFWDFQGAETEDDLNESFSDAMFDAEERLDQLGIALGDVDSGDLFRSMSKLRRRLGDVDRRLLLLCDEVEELVGLNAKDPSLLRRLRRAMQSREDIRTVMASKIGLWALSEQRGNTSPFLHGFTPPLYIQNLTDEEAQALARQANLPSESRPRFNDRVIDTILEHCNNHPYLIQLLGERYVEIGNLDRAIEEVATDPMVSFFFATDFDMLTDDERNILRTISERSASSSNSIRQHVSLESRSLSGALHRLEHLGYIRRDAERRFGLANYFFYRWFSELPHVGSSPQDQAAVETTIRPVESGTSTTIPVELGPFDDRYDLIQVVGKGATGTVFKAYDRTLRAETAIKVLNADYAGNEEAMVRVRREILLSRDLSHPNVVRVYHLGEWEGKKYLTMPWMDGPTLGDLIGREAPFAEAKTVEIAGKLASALEAAHARKVLHRDIKPQNILTDAAGEPYLTDFGLARLLDDRGMTSQGVFVGTPNYASPEQANLQPLDERSDVYSLGVVIFEMATGERPFRARSTADMLEQHRSRRAPSPQSIRPEISPELSKVILRCLEKKPGQRYQSARRLRRALERLRPDGSPKRRWLPWRSSSTRPDSSGDR